MKLIIRSFELMLLGVMLASAGCSDNDAALKLSSVTCTFEPAGGERRISVDASGASWTASVARGDSDWFVVTKEDDALRIEAPENTSGTVKRIDILVKSDKAEVYIDVAQAGTPALAFSISPEGGSVDFDCTGGSYTVAVSSNYEWHASSNQTWCDVSVDQDRSALTISAGGNESDTALTAKVTITSGPAGSSQSKEITVTQHTEAEHPYFALIGEWDLWSNDWLYNNQYVGENKISGIVISELLLNEKYKLSGLVLSNMEMEVYFNSGGGSVAIPLGVSSVLVDDNFHYYLARVNRAVTSIEKATLATGEVSQDHNTISLTDIGDGYGIGIVGVDNNGTNTRFNNLPYAVGSRIELRRTASPGHARQSFTFETEAVRVSPAAARAVDSGPVKTNIVYSR